MGHVNQNINGLVSFTIWSSVHRYSKMVCSSCFIVHFKTAKWMLFKAVSALYAIQLVSCYDVFGINIQSWSINLSFFFSVEGHAWQWRWATSWSICYTGLYMVLLFLRDVQLHLLEAKYIALWELSPYSIPFVHFWCSFMSTRQALTDQIHRTGYCTIGLANYSHTDLKVAFHDLWISALWIVMLRSLCNNELVTTCRL